VLSDILRDVDADNISFINAHGTATAYNDDMESIAIHRTGLDAVPVNGLKGYYGHTLGAAGIIETILSMKAIDNEVVLPTKGFETSGTTYSLNISNRPRKSDKTTFIKILSGFGGSNAGIAWQKGGAK
jgi:3-oxoacyl-[acyl-carrier-protein] synthase-1